MGPCHPKHPSRVFIPMVLQSTWKLCHALSFFSLRRVQSKDQGKQNTFMILLGGALTRGNDPIFDEYFSDGLKAPTGPTTSWNPRGHPRIRLGAAFGWEPNSTQAFPDYNSSR